MQRHGRKGRLGSAITTACHSVAAGAAIFMLSSSAPCAASALNLLDLLVFAKQSIRAERSDYQGPAAAGGAIELTDFNVDGDLTAGTGVSFDRGHVTGFVRSPHVRMSHVFSSGIGRPRDDGFEIASLKLDLLAARLAALSPTSRLMPGTGLDGKSEFKAVARRALEVVDIAGDRLTAAGEDRTRLVLTGGTRSQLLVRVHGRSVQMRHLAFAVSGGLDPSRIVLFFPEATDLEIAFSGGALQDNGETWNIPGSIVAPSAVLRFAASTVTGQVFAQSITTVPGLPSGQVDHLPTIPGQTGPFSPSQLLQAIGNDQVAAIPSPPMSSPPTAVSDQPIDGTDNGGCRLICTRRSGTP